MPLVRSYISLLIWAGLVLAGGCTPITPPAGKSPLHPAQMSPDSVVLDIFFVHCPFGDPEINEFLWTEVDEQQLPAALRQRLAQNGFRVGLIAGQIPSPLTRLMHLSDAPAAEDGQPLQSDELQTEQPVTGHHLPARAGQRNEVIASGIYPQLPVLVYEDRSADGCTYPNAQGIFSLKAFPEPDGRVRLNLVPELHYGDVHNHYSGENGVLRVQAGKSHRDFEDLAVSTVLSPGQLLIISSIPSRPGSLGHQFLTHQEAGKRQQKLLLIRVAQTQHQGLFSPTKPLDLGKETPSNR